MLCTLYAYEWIPVDQDQHFFKKSWPFQVPFCTHCKLNQKKKKSGPAFIPLPIIQLRSCDEYSSQKRNDCRCLGLNLEHRSWRHRLSVWATGPTNRSWIFYCDKQFFPHRIVLFCTFFYIIQRSFCGRNVENVCKLKKSKKFRKRQSILKIKKKCTSPSIEPAHSKLKKFKVCDANHYTTETIHSKAHQIERMLNCEERENKTHLRTVVYAIFVFAIVPCR